MIKERLISALLGTLFFMVFLPLGLDQFGLTRWFLLAGVGLCVVTSCLLAEFALRYILRMPNDLSRGPQYIIRRNIFFQVMNSLLMAVLLTFYADQFIHNERVANHLSWSLFAQCLAISVGVSIILGLYWRNVYWKRHYSSKLAEAERINGMLEERERVAQEQARLQAQVQSQPDNFVQSEQANVLDLEQIITLKGSTKEYARFILKDFLYAESEGNYVNVHYLKEGQLAKTLLRTHIKDVEDAFINDSLIIRCHRAFVVNLRMVSRIVGRSSGLMLALKHTDDLLPVSKTYTSEVKQKLQNPS